MARDDPPNTPLRRGPHRAADRCGPARVERGVKLCRPRRKSFPAGFDGGLPSHSRRRKVRSRLCNLLLDHDADKSRFPCSRAAVALLPLF